MNLNPDVNLLGCVFPWQPLIMFPVCQGDQSFWFWSLLPLDFLGIKCIVLHCWCYSTMLIAPPTGKISVVPLQVPHGNALHLHSSFWQIFKRFALFSKTWSDISLWVQLVDSPSDSCLIPPLLSLPSHSACLIPSHRILSQCCFKPDLENYWWKLSRERLLLTSLMCEGTRSAVSPNHTLLDWTQTLHGPEY